MPAIVTGRGVLLWPGTAPQHTTLPMRSTAQWNDEKPPGDELPPEPIPIAVLMPATQARTEESDLVLSPLPSWPPSVAPQHQTVPFSCTAQVLALLALTAIATKGCAGKPAAPASADGDPADEVMPIEFGLPPRAAAPPTEGLPAESCPTLALGAPPSCAAVSSTANPSSRAVRLPQADATSTQPSNHNPVRRTKASYARA